MSNPFAKKLGLAAKAEPEPRTEQTPATTAATVTATPSLLSRFTKVIEADINPPTSKDDESEGDLDIASLLDSVEEGKAPKSERSVSHHDDHMDAQAPSRELDADLTKQQLDFVALMDSIYDTDILHDPELLGGVIKNLMTELQTNPQYTKMVHKTDIHTWVKGMRNSMGLARIKKQETKTKRTGGAASKSKKADSDMQEALSDLGIDLGNL